MKKVNILFVTSKVPQNEIEGKKNYSYDTKEELVPGEMYKSTSYNKLLQIVSISEKDPNEKPAPFAIKELVVGEKPAIESVNCVYIQKV